MGQGSTTLQINPGLQFSALGGGQRNEGEGWGWGGGGDIIFVSRITCNVWPKPLLEIEVVQRITVLMLHFSLS